MPTDQTIIDKLERADGPDVLTWTGPHGLSLGGSFKGVNKPLMSGYWIHDHVVGRSRFKIYKIGCIKKIGSASTLDKAKAFCQDHIVNGAELVLAALRARSQGGE